MDMQIYVCSTLDDIFIQHIYYPLFRIAPTIPVGTRAMTAVTVRDVWECQMIITTFYTQSTLGRKYFVSLQLNR
jgi:hypothetical protein